MVQQKLRCNSCNAIVSDDISLKHCPTCRSSSVRLDPTRSRKEILAIREEMKHPVKKSSSIITGGSNTPQLATLHAGIMSDNSKKENPKNNNKQNTKKTW